MLKMILKTMRPKQWTKNLVLFAGLVFDGQLFNGSAFLRVLAATLLFCLVSGITYIINDLLDLKSDQNHPLKKERPIASGKLSPKIAGFSVLIIALITFPLAFALDLGFGIVCAVYFVLMIIYSKYLKQITLIDVMTIATGFVLRVTAGILVISVTYPSPWLFVLTSLLALFLGFGKRRSELVLLDEEASSHRKVLHGYTLPLLDQLIIIVVSVTLMAYCLYTFSASVTPQSHAMMFTIPFVLYGLLRYLYLLQTKEVGGAPEEVLLTDRHIQITLALWAIAIVIILYVIK